jgi:heme-degrading monooxygenase HmoA
MILEIAQIDVKPGLEAEFEAGVSKAASIFQRAKGCKAFEAQRSIELPSRYRLLIRWDTLENHTVDFRGSADFQEWPQARGPLLRLAARGRARERNGEGVLASVQP